VHLERRVLLQVYSVVRRHVALSCTSTSSDESIEEWRLSKRVKRNRTTNIWNKFITQGYFTHLWIIYCSNSFISEGYFIYLTIIHCNLFLTEGYFKYLTIIYCSNSFITEGYFIHLTIIYCIVVIYSSPKVFLYI
jgi:hypothetical protein